MVGEYLRIGHEELDDAHDCVDSDVGRRGKRLKGIVSVGTRRCGFIDSDKQQQCLGKRWGRYCVFNSEGLIIISWSEIKRRRRRRRRRRRKRETAFANE